MQNIRKKTETIAAWKRGFHVVENMKRIELLYRLS
jgi:hypothetical protein